MLKINLLGTLNVLEADPPLLAPRGNGNMVNAVKV